MSRGEKMSAQIEYEKGIANRGNWYRMKRIMERAAAGEKITLGFLGGSITQGSLSSMPETCYAYRVYEWWKKAFPKAEFTYVNAGIGGTTSQFGVARADSDLLNFHPDFVIVEFSVNDDDTEHFCETYEGLIRKIYSSDWEPAMLLVHNVRYDDGSNAQVQHGKIAKRYQIPAVSMKSTIYPCVKAGEIPKRDITPDDLHPNDKGHELVASVITWFLEKLWEKRDIIQDDVFEIPQPLTRNRYENSLRMRNDNCDPICGGFVADKEKQEHITQCFRKGWTARKKGDKIRFAVAGTCVGVQYRKSVKKPAPVARVVIDKNQENAIILDGNFEEDWGDCLYLETVAEDMKNRMHQVEIEIIEDHEDDVVPFYLVSVIGSC